MKGMIATMFALSVRIEPLPIGKICTIVQVGFIALILAFATFAIDAPSSVEALSVLTAAATIISGLFYGQLLLRALLPGSKPA